MSARSRTAGWLVVVLAAGCGGSSPHAAGTPTPSVRGPGVTTTIDGMTALPVRIPWRATTSLAPSEVSQVTFLVDGLVAWVDRTPPYTYGDDGNWLVTTFLRPGRHRFEVSLVDVHGRAVTSVTNALTPVPPAPPPGLRGRWAHQVTSADVARATSAEPPPVGRWTVTVDARGWELKDPHERSGTFDVVYAGAGRLLMHPTVEFPPYPNPTNGGFCGTVDPLHTWTWSGTRMTLRLAAVGADPCGDRVAILTGAWTRVA